jgi:hypothetical protein
MLAAHASAEGRVATFRSLGGAVGFSQPNTNKIYGQFAGRVRRQLKLPAPNIENLAIGDAILCADHAAAKSSHGPFGSRWRTSFFQLRGPACRFHGGIDLRQREARMIEKGLT